MVNANRIKLGLDSYGVILGFGSDCFVLSTLNHDETDWDLIKIFTIQPFDRPIIMDMVL